MASSAVHSAATLTSSYTLWSRVYPLSRVWPVSFGACVLSPKHFSRRSSTWPERWYILQGTTWIFPRECRHRLRTFKKILLEGKSCCCAANFLFLRHWGMQQRQPAPASDKLVPGIREVFKNRISPSLNSSSEYISAIVTSPHWINTLLALFSH